MDVDEPGREHVAEIVGRVKATLESVSLLERPHDLQILVDVLTAVELFTLAGNPLGDVKLPGIGTASGFGGDQDDKETFYIFTSYTRRRRFIATTYSPNKSELIRQPKVKFDPDRVRGRSRSSPRARTARACR